MRREAVWRTATAGVVMLAVVPALAQDRRGEAGGLRFSLGLENRLEYSTNDALTTPAEDPTTQATSNLTFALSDSTPTQQLRFSVRTGLRLANGPGTDSASVTRPDLRFSYNRVAANASFGLEAYWRSAEISFLRPLEDFANDEGDIDLPEDLDDLNGLGTRTTYGGKVHVAVGTEAPFGVAFDAETRVTDYTDVTDPDLVDSRRSKAALTTSLRFSDTDVGHAGLRYARYEADDLAQTLRQTRTVFVGYDRALSQTLGLTAELGYSEVDSEQFATTTTVQGFEGNVGLRLDLPNGTARADLSTETNQAGTRLTFELGRSLELPTGRINASFGATRPEGGTWAPVGELSWRHDLPTGRITTRLSRDVTATRDDSQALATLVALNYSHRINDVSSLSFNLSQLIVDDSDTDPTISRTRIAATYSRALTEDWNMNFGLAYRDRKRTGEARASSETVFISLSRTFDW